MKLYAISKVFYSIQGVGVHAGMPAVFIRFGSCTPRTCREPAVVDCDSVVPMRERITADEVAKLARISSFRCKWVVLTGSEPEVQLDADLASALHAAGFCIAVETNGSVALDHVLVDWMTITPKPGEGLCVDSADEIRYTVRFGDSIPSPPVPAKHCVLVPACDGNRLDQRDVEWCIQLVKDNPTWRLSLQHHGFGSSGRATS